MNHVEYSNDASGPGRNSFRRNLPRILKRLATLPKGSAVDAAGRCVRFGSSDATRIPLDAKLTEAELIERQLIELRAQVAMNKARQILARTK